MTRAALAMGALLLLAQVTEAEMRPVARDRILPRNECFFGLHFDLHPGAPDPGLYADCTEEGFRELLARVDPDYVQWDCKGHGGHTGYPTEVGWPSPGIAADALGILRRVTRERNTGLYIHYSGVWDNVALEHHPEWAVVNADGSRDSGSTSTFGPYVDELLIPQLREVIGRYGLDGVWADGECWAARLDWCDAAVARFRAETGLPEAPRSPGEPGWDAWKALHRRQFEAYLAHWIDAVHESFPEAQLASNWMYTTFAPKPVETNVDFLSGDYSPMYSLDRGRTEARYLASTGMPWDLMAWGFNWVDGVGHCLKPAEHLMQEAGAVLMEGGGFQIYNQPTRRGWIAPAMVEILGQVADFCRARQPWCQGSETVPQVAVLNSLASQLDRSDAVFTPYGCQDEIDATVQALLALGYSVDLAAEHRLEPVLDEYPLVVLPGTHKLEPWFRESLLGYVERGGSVLLLGAPSADLFRAELGVEFGEDWQAPAELDADGIPISCAGPWQSVTLAGAESLGTRYPTRRMDGPDGSPAATAISRGKGRLAAVHGPLALTYQRNHHPYLRRFLGTVVEQLLPEPTARVEGHGAIDLALRTTREGVLSAHLLNAAALPGGPYTANEWIPPVPGVELALRLPERPHEVTLAVSDEALEWTWEPTPSGGVARVAIPEVALYEIVLVR